MNSPPLTSAHLLSSVRDALNGSGSTCGPSRCLSPCARCGHSWCTRGKTRTGRSLSPCVCGTSCGCSFLTVSYTADSGAEHASHAATADRLDAQTSAAARRTRGSEDSSKGAADVSTPATSLDSDDS